MWKEKTLLMDEKAIGRAIRRIAHEIIERNKGLDKTVLVGIHTRGVPLAQRLGRELAAIEGRDVPVYDLDISAYRDDDRKSPIAVSDAGKFDADGQTVILVDDVLFTGRTVRSALMPSWNWDGLSSSNWLSSSTGVTGNCRSVPIMSAKMCRRRGRKTCRFN